MPALPLSVFIHHMVTQRKEVAFYERHIREKGGEALELACGAGRHFIPLVKRGLDVEGSDASAETLRYARMAAELNGLAPSFHHQPMEDLGSTRSVLVTIFIVNGSFTIMADRTMAMETLRRFHDHLIPGGQIILDLGIPSGEESSQPIGTRRQWKPFQRPIGEGEIHVEVWTEYIHYFDQIEINKREYSLVVDGRVVRTEPHTFRLTWFYKHEFTLMLEKAGFSKMRFYAENSDDPPDEKCCEFGCVAERLKS